MSSVFDQESLIGEILAERYSIRSLLGRGGCGQVYLAEHVTIDRRLAVKVMTGEQPGLTDETGRKRFLQEARATSKINHPHVIDIIDFGHTPGGLAYYVMEYLSGEDLAATLRREGALPWTRLGPMLLQICSALASAHRHGIIHRDIKPANCFRITVEEDPDFIKVLDFGIAKVHVPREQVADLPQTASHVLLGTPAYMAPELSNGGAATVRSDIYALGVLMFEMVTGKRPFAGSSFIETLFQHAYATPVIPSSLVPGLNEEVDRIILKAIARDPASRYADMRELQADIKASLAAAPFVSGPFVSVPVTPVMPKTSNEFVHATTDEMPLSRATSSPVLVPVDPPPMVDTAAQEPTLAPVEEPTPTVLPPVDMPPANTLAVLLPPATLANTRAPQHNRQRLAAFALLVASVGLVALLIWIWQYKLGAREQPPPPVARNDASTRAASTNITPQTPRVELPKPDLLQIESPQPEPVKPESPKPDAAPVGQSTADAEKPEAAKPAKPVTPITPARPVPPSKRVDTAKQVEPDASSDLMKQPLPTTLEPVKAPESTPPSASPKPKLKPLPPFNDYKARANMTAKLLATELACYRNHEPGQGFEFDIKVLVDRDGGITTIGSASSPLRKCLLEAIPENLNLGASATGGSFFYIFKPR